MISQSIGWKPTTLPLQIDGYLAWFYTDDYNSRVSSYEKNILYAFNYALFLWGWDAVCPYLSSGYLETFILVRETGSHPLLGQGFDRY